MHFHPHPFFALYNPKYSKILQGIPRSEVPPPQGLCIHEIQSRPCSGSPERGESSPVAIIIPTATMMRRE